MSERSAVSFQEKDAEALEKSQESIKQRSHSKFSIAHVDLHEILGSKDHVHFFFFHIFLYF